MVVGTINHKIAPVLKRVYDQMCEPKWVIAFGACASSEGVLPQLRHRARHRPHHSGGRVHRRLPAAPGGGAEGLMLLQKKVEGEGRAQPRRTDHGQRPALFRGSPGARRAARGPPGRPCRGRQTRVRAYTPGRASSRPNTVESIPRRRPQLPSDGRRTCMPRLSSNTCIMPLRSLPPRPLAPP